MMNKTKISELRKLPFRDNDENVYNSIIIIYSGEKWEEDDLYANMYIIGINGESMEIAAVCDAIFWEIDKPIQTEMFYPSGAMHFFKGFKDKYKFDVIGSSGTARIKLTR